MNLQELKKIASAATPGPWKEKGSPYNYFTIGPFEGSDYGLSVGRIEDVAYLTTFSPSTVLKLLAVVEAAKNLEAMDATASWVKQSKLRDALSALESEP